MQKYKLKTRDEHEGWRLDKFLVQQLSERQFSRGKIQEFIRLGQVQIDGRICRKSSLKLNSSQIVYCECQISTESKAVAQPGELDIIHEDEFLLVINKPWGLTVHPAPSVQEETLVGRLLAHYPQLALLDDQRPGIVHRLDKDTSGIIVIAKTEAVRLKLMESFFSRQVYKEYLALVCGVPEQVQGVIEADIGRHPSLKTKMAVLQKGGKTAKSEYKVVWRAEDKSISLLRVRIFTGRTHQIRVHLSYIGHPVLGDRLYGGSKFDSFGWKRFFLKKLAKRQLLHAWQLKIAHPVHNQPLSLIQAPPKDFLRVILLCSRNVQKIGLTGVAGCGKSTVLQTMVAGGAGAWSADQEVRQLYEPGQDGQQLLLARFGSRFVPDKQHPVDRQALLQALREENGLIREVNELIHPLVRHGMLQFFTKASSHRLAVAEVPLLTEGGWHREQFFDLVCTVFCSEDVRKKCMQTRGWSEELISLMDSWQWSQQDKVRAAHIVLPNTGSKNDLQMRVKTLLKFLQYRRRQKALKLTGWFTNFVQGWQES